MVTATILELNLNAEICGQLSFALENVVNPDQQVQMKVFEVTESLKTLPDYGIYLMAAVCNEGLSANARATAALQLKRELARANIEVRGFIKQHAEAMLCPLLGGSHPPVLVVGVAALLAEITVTLGYDVVSDMSQSIVHMLGDDQTREAALDLCNELLLNNYRLNPAIVGVLQQFLGSPLVLKVLNVCERIAVENPAEVKAQIIGPLLGQCQSMPSDVLCEMLVVIQNILAKDMDETLVRFVVACITNVNPNIGSLASLIFRENEAIPFCPEAVTALYQVLATDEELVPDGSISFEALGAIEAICERHPAETAAVLQSLFPKSAQDCSLRSVRSAIRAISGVFQFVPDRQVLLPFVVSFLDSPIKHEVASCMAAIVKQMEESAEIETSSEWVSKTAEVLAKLISDENASVRTQALRSLRDLFEAIPTPPQPFFDLISGCFKTHPEDELFLLLDVAAAFFDSVTSLESVDVSQFLQFICGKFMAADPNDLWLIYPLKVIAAVIPKIPQGAGDVVNAIGEKVLLGLQTDDEEFAYYCLLILSNLMDINPQHPIFPKAAPLIPQHLRLTSSDTQMLAWGIVSAIIRKQRELFGAICENVVEAALLICENEEYQDSATLCNVALVMFDVIPLLGVAGFSRKNAKVIFNAMLKGLDLASGDDVLDIQNIGCCIMRIISMYDKIECDQQVIDHLVPYLSQITDEAILAEVKQMLSKRV